MEDFRDFILRNNVIGFKEEPITFKSGRRGQCYVNWRVAMNDACLLDQLTDFILDFAKRKAIKPDSFYGVPEGATKLGVLTQYKWSKSQPDFSPGAYTIAMGRAKPKDHGAVEDKFFVGIPKGKTVVLEDTTTTGGSLLETIDNLQSAGVEVVSAIALTNRNEVRDDGLTVPQALHNKGVAYHALSNLKDLLPAAYEILDPPPEIRETVREYFKKYGDNS